MVLWIARDESHSLFIYEEKPHCADGAFWPKKGTYFRAVPAYLYPDVTYLNSPQMLLSEF